MLHFGLSGCKEQRELRWGDVVLKSDSEGRQYLEYSVERQTKTRAGENPRHQRQVKPRMYQNKTTESAERAPFRGLQSLQRQAYRKHVEARLNVLLGSKLLHE